MKTKSKKNFLYGDTLIEVMFAVGIFGIIAVSAISLMNRGVNTAQTALETEMARNEIDAQAEAIRFIHSAYAAEYANKDKEYEDLWKEIKKLAIPYNDIKSANFFTYPASITSCLSNGDDDATAAYTNGTGIIKTNGTGTNKQSSFIINTHKLKTSVSPSDIITPVHNSTNVIIPASTYPRLIFKDSSGNSSDDENLGEKNIKNELSAAEGIWVTAVKSTDGTSTNPQYYDFYIRTCWNSPGRGDPMTISTTIRLYNPDAK